MSTHTDVQDKLNLPEDSTSLMPQLTPYAAFTQPAFVRQDDKDVPHARSDVPKTVVQQSSPRREVYQNARRLFPHSDDDVPRVHHLEDSKAGSTPKQELRRSQRAHKPVEKYQAK